MNLDKEKLKIKRQNKNSEVYRTDLRNRKLFEITYKRVISGKAKHLTRNIYNSLLF